MRKSTSGGRDSSTLWALCTRPCTSMRLRSRPELIVPAFNLVSVIIPARNEARAIATVIQTVQTQPPAGWDLEIIEIDDGPSDGTAERPRPAGAQALVLESGTDGGNPARARNLGAAAA